MRRSIFALTLLLALPLPSTAATPSDRTFSSLEERMSAADFRRAGLEKLTEEELAALNDWLRTRGSLAPPPSADDRAGFESDNFFSPSGPERIESSIAGSFKGWEQAGERITLANGQVWRVTDSSTQLRVNLTNPRVTIERNAMGGWLMRVEGYNTRVRVARER